jgi:ubiquitin carboxyl-terminal hydrolase L5
MSSEGANDWCTIESDPGIFTEMLESLGVPDVELREVYTLDDLQIDEGTPIYGLIFLFQWIGEVQRQHAATKEPLQEESIPPGLFFAHQVTTNACATQAVLSVLLNQPDLPLGKVLEDFSSFTASFPPNLKGVAISSAEEIKTIHNSFARPEALWEDPGARKQTSPDKGEAFHFVAYIQKEGTVYELDGLQKGPIVVGPVPDTASGSTWLDVAKQALQERMTAGHVKFNLMAVTADPRVAIRKQLEAVDDDSRQALAAQLAVHDQQREQWKLENQRRRHNYLPLCIQLFKELAKTGTLPELVDQAKERYAAKRAAANAGKP